MAYRARRITSALLLALAAHGTPFAAPSDAFDGAWVLDGDATDRALLDEPPLASPIDDFPWIAVLCDMGWRVDEQGLGMGARGGAGGEAYASSPRLPSSEPGTRRYRVGKTVVELRPRGEHLVLSAIGGAGMGIPLWLQRVPASLLRTPRSDEERRQCSAAFDRIYKRHQSR